MSESRDSILDALKFRLKNSFLSSIIISWPIVNYKFLMIVFGGGNYSQKFKYIDEILYEPGDKRLFLLWIPIGVGLFYIIVFPLINILINLVDMYFKNLERRIIFWRQKRDVMTKDEKETHFTDLISTIQGLKDEMQSVRVSYSQQINTISNKFDNIESRARITAFKYLALTLGGPLSMANDISYLWTPSADFTQVPPDSLHRFVDSELFSNLRKFSAKLIQMSYDTDSRRVVLSDNDVRTISEVAEQDYDEFITLILAVGIMQELEYPRLKYQTHKFPAQNEINEKVKWFVLVRG